MNDRPTTHTIPVRPSRTFRDRPGHYEGTIDVRIGRRRYGIGGWDATGEGRIVSHGPYVPGPHAYAFQHATVITTAPLPQDPHVDARYGDVLEIDGERYRIEPTHNGNIDLVPVEA